MDPIILVRDERNLQAVIESSKDRFVAIMFYTKHDGGCRSARNIFEKIAERNASTSTFAIVDVDNFDRNSKMIQDVMNFPFFKFFYGGSYIGSSSRGDEKSLEAAVASGQQYVMCTMNNRNNMASSQMDSGMMMGQQMNGMNPMMTNMQQQQQFLNSLQSTNPMLAQQLSQNPQMLQQYMNQMMQPQMMPQKVPMISMPQTNNSSINPVMMNQLAQSIQSGTNSSSSAIPTLQQMQQMFQIFIMMQQMGLINVPNVDPKLQVPGTTIQPKESDVITTPDGDRLIPLGNGKYGLLKKEKSVA